VPTRKGSPKKCPARWPGKTSDRQVSKAPPPLRPLEGRGLLPERKLAPAERHPLAFDGPHWSPWQVLAWIVSRDRKLVEDMAPDDQSAQEKRKEIDWSAAYNAAALDAPASFGAALVAMAYAAEAGFITASGRRFYDGRDPGSRRLILRGKWSSKAILTDTILETDPSSKIKWMDVWFDRESVVEMWPSRASVGGGLTLATEEELNTEINAMYTEAENSGEKPPNVGEIRKPLLARLRAKGLYATDKEISHILKRFEHRRWRRGQRSNHPAP
jgi:hypothetical protein